MYLFSKEHITQNISPVTGSTKKTLLDTWRMIWEHDIKSIFMVTNLTENEKVDFIIIITCFCLICLIMVNHCPGRP